MNIYAVDLQKEYGLKGGTNFRWQADGGRLSVPRYF